MLVFHHNSIRISEPRRSYEQIFPEMSSWMPSITSINSRVAFIRMHIKRVCRLSHATLLPNKDHKERLSMILYETILIRTLSVANNLKFIQGNIFERDNCNNLCLTEYPQNQLIELVGNRIVIHQTAEC